MKTGRKGRTRADYERAAEVVRATRPAVAHVVLEAFVRLFATNRVRFDEARFRAACSTVPALGASAQG